MSSKADQRKQKKREKQKKKRADASLRRSRQVARLAPASLEATTTWPVGDCYLSENWHEHGARVHAIFTRRSGDGALAGAAFEVDLVHDGLVSARPLVGLTDGALQAELVRRADDHAMVTQDAAIVVKRVEVGIRLAESNGRRIPKDTDRAREIFGDVSSDDCPHELYTGDDAAPEPPRKLGIITRALDKLFGG
jgi:hypothetical protein